MKQQKELQRVAEQLRLARYGMVPSMSTANAPIDIRSQVGRIAYKSIDCGSAAAATTTTATATSTTTAVVVAHSNNVNQVSGASASLAHSDTEQQSYKLCDHTDSAHESVSRSSSPTHESRQSNAGEIDGSMQTRWKTQMARRRNLIEHWFQQRCQWDDMRQCVWWPCVIAIGNKTLYLSLISIANNV